MMGETDTYSNPSLATGYLRETLGFASPPRDEFAVISKACIAPLTGCSEIPWTYV